MADLKIDEAKALVWAGDVFREVEAVERLLVEVRSVRTATVGENDTIFQLIEKSANLMDEVWTNTTNAFKKGWNILRDGLSVLRSAGQRIGEAFDDLNKKI